MINSLVRTFRGPSRDPRMAYISRPMPRDLRDEDVIAALDIALAEDPKLLLLYCRNCGDRVEINHI